MGYRATRTARVTIANLVAAGSGLILPTRAEDGVPTNFIRVLTGILVYGIGGASAGHYTVEFRSDLGGDFHAGIAFSTVANGGFTVSTDFASGIPCANMQVLNATNLITTPRAHTLPGAEERVYATLVSGTAASAGNVLFQYTWVDPAELAP